jgi:hypothetical protein
MTYTFYVEFLQNRTPFAIFAWLIQFVIKRPYNHVEIVAIPDRQGFPILYYGAVSPRSRQTTVEEIRKKYKVIKRYKLDKQTTMSDLHILKYLNDQLGIDYAYDQNVMLLLMSCWTWLKSKLSRAQVNHEKKMNCVEFVARPMVDCFGYRLRTSFDAVEFEDIVISLEAR